MAARLISRNGPSLEMRALKLGISDYFRSASKSRRNEPQHIFLRFSSISCIRNFQLLQHLLGPTRTSAHAPKLHFQLASTLSSIVSFWTSEFSRGGISTPSTSAELILAHCIGRKTLEGMPEHQRISSAVSTMMTTLAMQRLDGIPLQYVIGEWDFRYLTLAMQSPVFIPRPETEELVGYVIRDIKERIEKKTISTQSRSPSSTPIYILEIGCGSGAIALSLINEIPSNDEELDHSQPRSWHMSAIDISPYAIELTRLNAKKMGVEEKLLLRHASIAEILQDPFPHPFSVVVSNPPYLPSSWLPSLPIEVTHHEDHTALFGGEDGGEVIREMVHLFQQDDMVKRDGSLWMEIESSQEEMIRNLILTEFEGKLELKQFKKDFRDVVRFVEIRKTLVCEVDDSP